MAALILDGKELSKITEVYIKKKVDELSSKNILVAAHGNSLRALVKHLEDISEQEIVKLEIATGVPIIYKFSNGSYTKH